MSMYAFAVRIVPGKIENLRRYMQEMKSSRWGQFMESRKRMGVHAVQVWLQHTPNGDIGAVWLDVDSPAAFFKAVMTSNEPFDVWFREKIIFECQGIKPGDPPPDPNELLLDYSETGHTEKTSTYAEAKNR